MFAVHLASAFFVRLSAAAAGLPMKRFTAVRDQRFQLNSN